MYSADKIRNADIKKVAFGGYHMDEVDDLLDLIADEFEKLEQVKAEVEAKYAILSEKMEAYRSSENSIHTTLLNAQRLADQTVKEASEAAGHTTTEAAKKAETIVNEAVSEANQIVEESNTKANAIIADAIAKTESMIAAAHDSVARQQMLFDKLKVETCNLRDSLLEQYKEQILLVQSLPDEVPFDAERAAEVITFAFDNVPDYEAMAAAAKPSVKPVGESIPEVQPDTGDEPENVDYSAVLAEAVAKEDQKNEGGFVVNTNADEMDA